MLLQVETDTKRASSQKGLNLSLVLDCFKQCFKPFLPGLTSNEKHATGVMTEPWFP